MTNELILAPSLQSAQNHLIGRIGDLKRDDPALPVTLLVPSVGAKQHLKHRLGNSLNIRIFQFADLSREILEGADKRLLRANSLTIERLVSHLLKEMASRSDLTTFEKVHKKPGFIEATIDWLEEMKSRNITPADVENEAGASGRERDRQLAILYRRYQDFLDKRRLADKLGFISMAAEALELGPEAGPGGLPALELRDKELFIIGFDHFSPLELRLLAQLVPILLRVTIYLPWNEKLPADGLALGRISRTRRTLGDALELTERHMENSSQRPPMLEALSSSLFTPAATELNQEFQSERAPSITAVAAPSRENEVRQALRAIKKLLLRGINPSEVALLTPQYEVYRPLIQAVASEYEIVIDEQADLDTNPAVSALINLLELAPAYPWRQTFNALRSPYIGLPLLTNKQLDTLEKLTRERPVISGRSQWNYALKPLELSKDNPHARKIQERPHAASLTQEQLKEIAGGLEGFFDLISPKKKKSYSEHAFWLQDVILGVRDEISDEGSAAEEERSSFHMVDCCSEDDSDQKDRTALAEVLAILKLLINAANVVPMGSEREITWDTFRRDFIDAIRDGKIPKDPGTQAIQFSTLNAVRSLSVDYLFVLGLAEGEFPRRQKADPFYSQIERAASNLPLRLEDPSEDANLWWQTINNCRRSLTILRPWLDSRGVPWLPSPYWRAVIDPLAGLVEKRLPMASLPAVREAASRAELLLSLADTESEAVPAELEGQWLAIKRAQEVAAQRSSWRPPGIYEGVIASSDLLNELTHKFGSDHVWSPSRLNNYGNCPYGFFAEHILDIETKAEPEEGFDAMQRGRLIHSVLEAYYLQLRSEDLPPTLSNQSAVLDRLEAVFNQTFSWAPQRYGFRPGPLWEYEQEELGRILRAFVRWECEENQEFADYRPLYLELFFGFSRSSHGMLVFDDADSLKIKVRGIIDRVDVNDKGQAVVIDYKSGSGLFSKRDIGRGLAFQTPLYALAVDQLFSHISSVSVSKYLLVTARKASGVLKFSGPVSENETVQAAIDRAGAFVHNVRHGFFPSAPGKPTVGSRAGGVCRSHCHLAPLCRVTRMSIAKVKYL